MTHTIQIEPKLISVFPIEKTARFLYINNIAVALIDNGVNIIYQLLDINHSVITQQEFIQLPNDSLVTWVNSDEQLVDILLSKLNLVKSNEPIEQIPNDIPIPPVINPVP